MMSKVSATTVRQNPNLLLLAAIAFVCLAFAINTLFIADPGSDGGSGIGGTGKLGGESGLGGTGGPAPDFGAVDLNRQDAESDEFTSSADQVPLVQREPLIASQEALIPVDASTLRLSPDTELKALKVRLTEIQDELDQSLQQVADQTRLAELDRISTDKNLQPASFEFEAGLQSSSLAGYDNALIDSMEITRQLMLAETSSSLFRENQTDISPAYSLEDENLSAEEMRRRVSVPARPERPDRPNIPRRAAPSQRGIPTPPVRPLRL